MHLFATMYVPNFLPGQKNNKLKWKSYVCFNAPAILSLSLFLLIADISSAGPKDGFVSKWVYNFWPAKNLYVYQDIHIGGNQQQKLCTKLVLPTRKLFLPASWTFLGSI